MPIVRPDADAVQRRPRSIHSRRSVLAFDVCRHARRDGAAGPLMNSLPSRARRGVHAPSYRRMTFAFAGVASLFGIVLVLIAAIAARNLLEREEAVLEGRMLRAGHEVERGLRDAGPEGADEVLDAFVAAGEYGVVGAEVVVGTGVVSSAGEPRGDAVEMPVFLGPAWRGMGSGHGEPNRGGSSPYRLRLTPAPGSSQSVALARAIVVVALVTALALVVLAISAGAGLGRRAELAAVRAEGETLRALANAGAGLAHTIRNPLASIKGTAQLLAGSAEARANERAERIVDASERIDRTLAELLRFARPPEAQPESLEVTKILRDVFVTDSQRVAVEGSSDFMAWVDREHLIQIVEELVANARAFDPEGRLELTVRGDASSCAIDVADRGSGLTIAAAAAFEPYVTTRADGTGLGLSIVRALAAANGGAVTLRARAGGGTVATLLLPTKGEK